jgi:phosphate butyryltransferase
VKLHTFIERANLNSHKTVAVAAAEAEEVLEAVAEAIRYHLARFILFGNRNEINRIIREKFPALTNHEKISIIHAISQAQAAEYAVKAVNLNEADVLMKGKLSTAILLKAVLNKENGLRTGNILSHVAVFEVQGFEQLVIVTDSAMNIAPDLETKVQIIKNAVTVANWIGIHNPKVAALAAVEVVNPAMQATVDAALLTQMNRRGQITGCVIDGPLALDNAISMIAAEQKGINSEVAGRADILLVPAIETGNALYKSLVYFAKAKVGAVVVGAKAPIVLTSRSDNAESKLYSLALSLCSETSRHF